MFKPGGKYIFGLVSPFIAWFGISTSNNIFFPFQKACLETPLWMKNDDPDFAARRRNIFDIDFLKHLDFFERIEGPAITVIISPTGNSPRACLFFVSRFSRPGSGCQKILIGRCQKRKFF